MRDPFDFRHKPAPFRFPPARRNGVFSRALIAPLLAIRRGRTMAAPEETPCNCLAEFGKFIAAETDKWAKVVKFADIKPK
jgi:hypothetical protein